MDYYTAFLCAIAILIVTGILVFLLWFFIFRVQPPPTTPAPSVPVYFYPSPQYYV